MGTIASNERGPLESGFRRSTRRPIGSAPHDAHEYSLTGPTRSFELVLIVGQALQREENFHYPSYNGLNSEVWILVLDQSAFSAVKRARLSRNYLVQLV